MAVHAFVPVAALHRGLSDAGHPLSKSDHFAVRRAEVLAGNATGMAVLREKAQATGIGSRVLNDLRAAHDQLVTAAPDLPTVPMDAMPPG